MMGIEQLAEEPVARNSKRLPVKAKGDVRLRSVLSSIISGILPMLSFMAVFPSGVNLLAALFSMSFIIAVIVLPQKTESTEGGASLPPRRWALVAEAMEAISNDPYFSAAIRVQTKNVRKSIFPLGLWAGAIRFTPVLVDNDQLQCLPLPFIPWNGFSWKMTLRWCLGATLFIIVIRRMLWSAATLASSYTVAHSNWLGATSLWRVLRGMPSLYACSSNSFIKFSTLPGMAPQ